MAWAVTAEPQRFDEAVAWFANRFPVTEELSEALGSYAGERAWKIAGVAQLEIVQSAHRSLEAAIASGIPFEDWKEEVEEELVRAWGGKNSARLETIFVNACQQSQNAGRWSQMNEPTVLALRPFGMYDSVRDTRTSPFCNAWDGTILPLQEFAERGACPQTHHRCRANIRSMRASDVDGRGGPTKTTPTIKADKGFGAPPTVADWHPDRSKYDPKIWNAYQEKAAELEKSPRRLAKTG